MKQYPNIGVTTSKRGGQYMWWFYWLALRLNGVRPKRLIAPANSDDLRSLDGLIVGGGDNISAKLYKGEPEINVRIDLERDALEQEGLKYALKRDIPVLGICRGAQMLNVILGGSLHQDIYKSFAGVPEMWTALPRKKVYVAEGSKLSEIMNEKTFHANSLHRQSIDKLGEGLEISAKDRHGIIQAIEDKSAFFRIGVQWHPEFLIFRSSQRNLFKAFVDAVWQKMRQDNETKNLKN